MQRRDFEELVARTAYCPSDAATVLAELEVQLAYQPEPRHEGLPDLADPIARALQNGVDDALPALARAADAHPQQPLCHLYLCSAALEAGDRERARVALTNWRRADPSDPMAEFLALSSASRRAAGISEETRLANLAKFARTPLLRDPYRMAVDSIFEAIREREAVKVLDVGVGSGAQMAALLDLLAGRSHRVRRIEILGLDFVEGFLDAAADTIAERASRLAGRVEVVYLPLRGRVEAIEEATFSTITAGGPLDAINATLALHEVAGEAKLGALANLRRLAPGHVVLAEWNYCLENTLSETSVEFFFNVRRFLAAMVAALRLHHSHVEARAVARDWLSMAGGQLTSPASERQECFLDAATWTELLEHAGFTIGSTHARSAPIALIEASSRPYRAVTAPTPASGNLRREEEGDRIPATGRGSANQLAL